MKIIVVHYHKTKQIGISVINETLRKSSKHDWMLNSLITVLNFKLSRINHSQLSHLSLKLKFNMSIVDKEQVEERSTKGS